MENKINIAELLKDCQKGMELDCTICNGVKFIEHDRNPNFPIVVRANNGYEFSLTKYGQVHNIDDAKCVIFPKGKTTWDGFIPPCKFKDGDVVSVTMYPEGTWIGIFKQYEVNSFESHCYLDTIGEFHNIGYKNHSLKGIHLATEEEKKKLFQEIKDKGYKWNAETKTLEKLTIPKFNVGDKIVKKNKHEEFLVSEVYDKLLDENAIVLSFSEKNEWNLVHNKFDITTLKPFDKVLVRCSSLEKWRIQLFEKYDKTCKYPFICMGYNKYKECIPYEQNEHLLDTTDDCDEYYKTW